MKIVIDTREQTPLDFGRYDCEVVRGGLATGDYSIFGLESLAAVERKSEDDLLGCLTRERDRFERELARARGMELFAVVAETTWERLARGMYRSRMRPEQLCCYRLPNSKSPIKLISNIPLSDSSPIT